MSDSRQQDSKIPARDQQAEELENTKLTKEQEDKIKGGLKGTQRSGIWEN